jgi:cyclopropane fatty-acyl-phospholipid synthase-like methyltransferase
MDEATEARSVVREGYARIAEAYLRWIEEEPSPEQESATRELLLGLPAGARVLELGCGPGWPTLDALAERLSVVGVDLSRAQLSLAAGRVPAARLVEADLTRVEFREGVLDAVVSFFVLLHVPREEWADVFVRIRRWLRPGGLLSLCVGAGDNPGAVEPDFLGAPMYFSGWDPPTTLRLLREAGFTIESSSVAKTEEHGEPAAFHWVLARAS